MSQNDEVLIHLQKGNKMTWLDGLKLFKCRALNSRVSDLRKRGYNIKSEFIKVGKKTVSQYSMEVK